MGVHIQHTHTVGSLTCCTNPRELGINVAHFYFVNMPDTLRLRLPEKVPTQC